MRGKGNVFPNPNWKLCLFLILPSNLDLNNSYFFSHWLFPIAAHPLSEHLAFGISYREAQFSSSHLEKFYWISQAPALLLSVSIKQSGISLGGLFERRNIFILFKFMQIFMLS